MGLGGFLAGWGIGGTIIGLIAGIIAFFALVIMLYNPAISLMTTYHITGLLALVIYIAFALTVIPIAASLIGFICGTVGGFIIGIIVGAIS